MLLPWAVLAGFALRAGPYGLTEEGSKALMLAWSVADQVPSSAITLGAPDIRFILFLPLALPWPGSLLAAKVLTLLVMAAAGAMLYRWRERDGQAEAALLATGLLLVSPLAVERIDALSTAPFLLAICAMASWLDRKLSLERGTLGGWFFAQVFLCGAAVSLHPAGLAYPAVLMRHWWTQSKERRDRQVALMSIPMLVGITLIIRAGWSGTGFGQNPLLAAAAVFTRSQSDLAASVAAWLGGLILMAATAAVALNEGRRLMADLTGSTLVLLPVFGLLAADKTWALLMFALLLYGGFPWVLRACEPLKGRGLLVQRGWLWLALLLVCTVFMQIDRADFDMRRLNLLSAEDELIKSLVVGINSAQGAEPAAPAQQPILVASPWPARTSIACRCAALPLPPLAKDPQSQLDMMRGVSYVMLADSPETQPLADNFAQLSARVEQLSSRVEVMSKQPGGVILRLKSGPRRL